MAHVHAKRAETVRRKKEALLRQPGVHKADGGPRPKDGARGHHRRTSLNVDQIARLFSEEQPAQSLSRPEARNRREDAGLGTLSTPNTIRSASFSDTGMVDPSFRAGHQQNEVADDSPWRMW